MLRIIKLIPPIHWEEALDDDGERQKSHIMDDKHTATRDKMAEDVEARITAEAALRQQYRFDLEKRTFWAFWAFFALLHSAERS